jgi:hypothetical protein
VEKLETKSTEYLRQTRSDARIKIQTNLKMCDVRNIGLSGFRIRSGAWKMCTWR